MFNCYKGKKCIRIEKEVEEEEKEFEKTQSSKVY